MITEITIKDIKPLFKGEESANNIELVNFIENGFTCVVQKGLYKVNESVLYIEPDYCLKDHPIFDGFIKPNNDETKSYLGKIDGVPRRIRAKKFDFSLENNTKKVYSNGIILNKDVLDTYPDLSDFIFKYEEPESFNSLLSSKGVSTFPNFLYRSGETNGLKIKNSIKFPLACEISTKVDGSSIAVGIKDGEVFVCSRNCRINPTMKKFVKLRKKKWFEYLLFWKRFDLRIFNEVENDNPFWVYSKPIREKLETQVKEYGIDLVIRGELIGQGLIGSGNPKNPDAKGEPRIVIYNVDKFHNSEPIGYKTPIILRNTILNSLNLLDQLVPVVYLGTINSYEEMNRVISNYFKSNPVEGVVVKSLDLSLSFKIMNDEYDSKK